MYKLNGQSGDKTGLGITVKVMSGDNVMIYGKSFWHTNGSNPANSYTLPATDLLTLLAGTPVITGANKVTASSLTGSTSITNGVSNWLNNAPATGTAPKAYLNWILFDEQFKPVSASSGFDAVSSSTDDLKSHAKNVDIAKNGYLYVYASNESDVDVFFDNLQLIHNHGPLLEETHYYPFGLTMAGISSKAVAKLGNEYKYNGKELQEKEFSDGNGLELYDYGARVLDPQLGRWHSVDPLADMYQPYTPYAYVLNNPIKLIDPNGMYSTHTDEEGNVIAVDDQDGDKGVYRHKGNKEQARKEYDEKHSKKNTAAGGEKMGETEYMDEFINPDTRQVDPDAKILFGQDWQPTLDKYVKKAEGMNLKEVAAKSRQYEDLDVKRSKEDAPNGISTGKLLNGKYATARSAGNYLAGYLGATHTMMGVHLNLTEYMRLAGAFQVGLWDGKSILTAIKILNVAGAAYGTAPYYGEMPYSGRMIIKGFTAGESTFFDPTRFYKK